MKKYWFKPKRFWNWFAAYYPVSWQGWVVAVAFIIYLKWQIFHFDVSSYSLSDTLIALTIRFGFAFIVLDIITRLTGEYPSWWRRKWFRK